MFTVLILTLAVELVLYARLRRDRAETLPRMAQRKLIAQKGRAPARQLKPHTLRSRALTA